MRAQPGQAAEPQTVGRYGETMDEQTLDSLSSMICGDGDEYPIYRSGSELTRFFQRVGFSNFVHDGSTRKWWTLNVLKQLTKNNLYGVIRRLADPKEYRGDEKVVKKAMDKLNQILSIEGLMVELNGINPTISETKPTLITRPEKEVLLPLPPPDFLNLALEPGLGEILSDRWTQAQKCITDGCYLAAIILMGSMLEGILLAVLQKLPQEVNQCKLAPHNPQNGKVKHFSEWTLAEMINVAHDLGWIDLDVKKFSHALREFRNLIHPYQQLLLKTYPDKTSCDISWLVVQAATNDLAKKLL
jgi:hypothetical protein